MFHQRIFTVVRRRCADQPRRHVTDFSVTMASSAFDNLSAIKRHRLVNGLLKEEFDQMGLHALSLRLRTVEEAQKEGLVEDTKARADVPSCKGSVV
jgi:stress-induced morphogen